MLNSAHYLEFRGIGVLRDAIRYALVTARPLEDPLEGGHGPSGSTHVAAETNEGPQRQRVDRSITTHTLGTARTVRVGSLARSVLYLNLAPRRGGYSQGGFTDLDE